MFPEVIDPENIAQKLIQSPDALFSVVASGYENSKIIEISIGSFCMSLLCFLCYEKCMDIWYGQCALFGGLGPEVYESIEL